MVSARGDDGLTGAVYVYDFDGKDWIQSDKLTADDAASGDEFGVSINLVDDRVVIGSSRDDDNAFNSGGVYVFELDPMSETWSQAAKILPDGTVFEEFFGSAVSLNGDRILVGAYNATNPAQGNVRTGSAYVFDYDGTNWNQTDKLYADDGTANSLFGFAVSLWGDNALVGSHGNQFNTGAAYMFTFNGSSWEQVTKLVSDDAELEDAIGISVSMRGDRALLGAYRGNNSSEVDSGAAYVFDYDGTTWVQGTTMTDNGGANNDFFGRSVSLTNSWLLAGATGDNDNKGEVHIYLDDPVYADGFN